MEPAACSAEPSRRPARETVTGREIWCIASRPAAVTLTAERGCEDDRLGEGERRDRGAPAGRCHPSLTVRQAG